METIELDAIRIFIKVVQHSSFSKAANTLKLPKSTVSKTISRLEAETGTRLLLRTTRHLTLTAAGRLFFEASLGPVTALEEAQKSLYGQDTILNGNVKITAPEDLGTVVIAPAVAALSMENPSLSFELQYTDEVLDLVKEGVDLAVRIGRVNESAFKLKRVGQVALIPVASPAYLKKADKPLVPKDLQRHPCLSLNSKGLFDHWFLRSSKATAKIPIRSKVSANQMTTLLNIARLGGGVALLPYFLCKADLDRRTLVRLLPDWSSPGMPVSVITPLSPASSARLRLTRERIVAQLQGELVFRNVL